MIKGIWERVRLHRVRQEMILFGKTIRKIDRYFTKIGMPNWKRKQFWQDFIKSEEYREKFIKEMRL
jgi:hypothetical protein